MNSKKPKTLFVSTLSIKLLFILLLFMGVPYLLISISTGYQKKASGILDQESALVEIQTEKAKEMKVLTQAEATTLSRIHDFIGGTWISENDGRYKILIDSNNKFEEFYDDTKEGFGVWRVFSGALDDVSLSNSPEIADESTSKNVSKDPSSRDSQVSTTASPAAYTQSQFEDTSENDSKYFFQKQQYEPAHHGEKYIYQIQQLDTENFILVYKGGTGRPLVFVRSTSTISDILRH